jgi:hypothetical protein
MSPTEVRRQLRSAGYIPTPCNGKHPVIDAWQTRLDVTDHEIELWDRSASGATNTGILTRTTPVLDIDILDPQAAQAVEEMVRDRFEEHGYVLARFGRSPKRAIPFRTNAPFAKIKRVFGEADTPERDCEKLELLCDGQQIVVHGVHPDTHKPYSWARGDAPGKIKHDDLPYIHEEEAHALVDDAVKLLIEKFGYRLKPAKPSAPGDDGKQADWSFTPDDLIDHDRLAALAMRLIKGGMNGGAAVNFLRGQVSALANIDESRRQRRIKEIPDMVSSAQAKLGSPGEDIALPPPPELESLTAEAWAAKKLPPRDHLMGTLLSTTSRWMVQADTGTGKTLLVMAIAMAVAANRRILHWASCGRPRRVMYIDGDLPAETCQERVKLMLALYGAAGVKFFAYNLDQLEREGRGFEPFNTTAGRAWLEREIERVKPDLIVFDSVMCLTIDAMTDDRSWRPVAELMGWLTGRRIAQIWVHHTGHDPNRGFGTKSREWRLDTVVLLTEANNEGLSAEEGAPVEMRFKKARLRTPQNSNEFQELKIACGPQGWRAIGELSDKPERGKSEAAILTKAFCDAYDQLSDGAEEGGYVGSYKILKVSVARLRDALKSAGWLDADEKGQITEASRTAFRRVKSKLLAEGGFQEQDGMICRTRPHPQRAAALRLVDPL